MLPACKRHCAHPAIDEGPSIILPAVPLFLLMLMTVMYFRDMRMIMSKQVVPMTMRMGSPLFNFFMLVLVMICMRMAVIMFHLIMNMMMSMAFRQQHNDAEAHKQPGQRGLHCPVLAENGNRGHRAHEESDGKNPASRAAPRSRRACTSRTRLMP